jgi:hypothetical protein
MGKLVVLSTDNGVREQFEQDVAELLSEVANRIQGFAIVMIVDDVPLCVYSAQSRLSLVGALHHALHELETEATQE